MLARLAIVGSAALLALLGASPGWAATPWPPAKGAGQLYVHFGEEHWNDADGLTLLPKVVADSIRYRPDLVTMSGDKANDGNPEELGRWHQIMEAYDRAGIVYYAGVGNHDRDVPPGQPGGLPPPGSLGPYRDIFSDRPYPFGDAGRRPADDPAGAASHYYVDHRGVRWIFIDNSCWTIEECDAFQAPSAQNAAGRPQLEWLGDVAGQAQRAGRFAFVVMHMPTQDPGDQDYREVTAFNHVMGKGTTDDNAKFERVVGEAGVDGVFVGHIKGQFLYRGRGGIPYYIDGGAGGELYTDGPVGADHGYWHGYRLIRVNGGRFRTDSVPIFVRGGIRVVGPARLARGAVARFEAFGRQPVFNDPAKVPALELRDPDPVPKQSGGALSNVSGGAWLLAPLAAFLLAGLATLRDRRPRARPALAGAGLVLAASAGLGAVAVAQRSEPTATKKENLPNPARIWTSSDRFVLAPVASSSEDSRRNPRTQTHDGGFGARCPGRARVTVTSGFEERSHAVTVTSRRGRIVRRVRIRRRSLVAGRKRRVAQVRLGQPAQVLVRVRRRGRTLRTLRRGCFSGRRLTFFWDGRLRRRGKLRRVRGRHRIDVTVRSDRRTLRRSRRVLVRRR